MSGMAGMEPNADGSVAVSATQIKQFGITFGQVAQRTLTNDVRAVGTVVIDESGLASVTPKISGFVERLYVNVTGQPVRRGEALAEIYSPDVVAAQEELLLARRLDRTMAQASVPGVPAASGQLLAAAMRRLRLLDVSQAQIDGVLRTGQIRRTITLYAPASGIVIEKKVVVGQAIQAGTELYSIANLSTVWVDVQLREADGALVAVGSTATLEFASYPGEIFRGKVAFVYPTVAEATRSLRARIVVGNSLGVLRPGMYATVHVVTPTISVLTIPRTAAVQTGTRTIVFLDIGDGKLLPREITLGAVVGEFAQVMSGLTAGQTVVTSAQFLIDSESNLGEVMRSMVGNGGGAPAASGSGDMSGMDMGKDKGADTRGMRGVTTPNAPVKPAGGRQ
jgi:Cu(I)/Ag(I) efflux system membrane fusion protein